MERRFPEEDQDIQGIAVLGKGLRDESVVARVVHGRKEHAVELEDLALLIEFVLFPATLRDLDDDLDDFVGVHESSLTIYNFRVSFCQFFGYHRVLEGT